MWGLMIVYGIVGAAVLSGVVLAVWGWVERLDRS